MVKSRPLLNSILEAVAELHAKGEKPEILVMHPTDIAELLRHENFAPGAPLGSGIELGKILGLRIVPNINMKIGHIAINFKEPVELEWNPSRR